MFLLTCSFTLLLSATSPTSAQQNGDLRLVGGETVNEGRVEVYYDRQWGTICDDRWHFRDADVICKVLGYERSSQIYNRAHFGEGGGPIWIDDLECPSSAASILDCRHRGWGVHNCQHHEDAGVQCKRIEPTKPSQMPVRLNCPSYTQSGTCVVCPSKQHPSPGDCTPQAAVQGIVEALYDDEWRPVSLDGWNENSARIVCSELGYPITLGSPPTLDELWSNWHTLYCQNDSVGSGDGGISQCAQAEIEENDNFRARLNSTWLKKLDCTGTERRLLDCYFQEFGPNSNPALQVATVRCGFKPHDSCSTGLQPAVKETYRVRGGAVPWIGRLEVYVGGEWGTVCDREFDMREANIACRGMGYGSARWLQWGAFYGRGVGKVHYSALKCKGNETYLADCEHRPGRYCGHHGDVSVECTVPEICGDAKRSKLIPVPDPTYFGYINEFLEVKGPVGWGLLCANSLNQNAASLVCRDNKNLFVSEIRSAHHAAYNGTRYSGVIFCSDDDENIDDCLLYISKVNSCPQGEAVIFCTSRLPDLVPDVAEFQRSLQYYPYVESRLIYYLTCALEEDCLASSAYGKSQNHARRLLRFSSLTNNWGVADFQPILDRTQWVWHSCHSHYHSFEAFVHYDLLNKTTGAKVAEGHKASFCLEDSICANGGSRYRCGTGHQGISANCGDLYGRHLDCQWIDVTDVPPGTYQLRQHVNPDKLSLESDYRNNIISCDITFNSGTYFTVGNFTLSDH